jgi:hypothetical protein
MGVGRNEVYRLLRTPGFPVSRLSNRWVTTYAKLFKWAEGIVPDPKFPESGVSRKLVKL